MRVSHGGFLLGGYEGCGERGERKKHGALDQDWAPVGEYRKGGVPDWEWTQVGERCE